MLAKRKMSGKLPLMPERLWAHHNTGGLLGQNGWPRFADARGGSLADKVGLTMANISLSQERAKPKRSGSQH